MPQSVNFSVKYVCKNHCMAIYCDTGIFCLSITGIEIFQYYPLLTSVCTYACTLLIVFTCRGTIDVLNRISKAADAICDGNLVERQVRSQNDWNLLPAQVSVCMCAHVCLYMVYVCAYRELDAIWLNKPEDKFTMHLHTLHFQWTFQPLCVSHRAQIIYWKYLIVIWYSCAYDKG